MKRLSLLVVLTVLGLKCMFLQAQDKKVAVVTFYTDKHIDLSEIPGAIGSVAAIASLAEDEKFNLQPVLDEFHETFFTEYTKQFPFTVLEEDKVINNEDYKNFESHWKETEDEDRSKLFQRYLTFEGYHPLVFSANLASKDNKNQTKMLEIFDDVDGVLFVSLSYAFTPKMAVGGMGTAGIRGYVHLKLWNKEGDKVFNIRESAVSKKSVGLIAGVPAMDPAKLVPMCKDASEQVIEDLQKKLKKIAKKSAKKL